MPLVIDGRECEEVIRHADYVEHYGGWPVCTWDGASGQDVARTLDGTKWYVRERAGWDGPGQWRKIMTPARQPAVGGKRV